MNCKLLLIISVTFFTLLSCNDDNSEEEVVDIELDYSTLTLEVGEEATISIVKAPSNGETAVWSSDNETVATVFYGAITALASGTANITVTMGDDSAVCEVTVAEREYQLVWSDEFNGTELDTSNWTYDIGTGSWGWGNNEEEYYTNRSENIRVEDGCLVIEALKESYEGSDYTSARIKTINKQSFAYGKIEARLQVPAGEGVWPALWMLGMEGSWPDCGEIDIMEHVGTEPKNFHCALHTENYNGSNGNNSKGTQTLEENCADDFHVIKLEWVEQEFMGYDRIHVYVDGVKTTTFAETSQLQSSGDWPFTTPFYLIVNLALGGNWGGTIDDSIFDDSVLYKIDYIRVYQYQ